MRIDKYYRQTPTNEKKTGETKQDTDESPKRGTIKFGTMLEKAYNNKFFLLAIVIVILIINIVLRVGLLKYQGLFEPDGFFYLSVIREMVNNHMLFGPSTLSISGFPTHNAIGESPGLMAVAAIPYYVLSFTGLSYYTVMRWIPIVFGVLEAIVAYFIAKHLSNSKTLGLLAMAFVSLSSGNIARTAGTVFRGDSFISLFLMVALLFMLRAYSSKERKWIYINSIIAAIILSLGFVVWNGSPFIIAVYMLSLVLVFLYSFIMLDEKLAFANTILSACLLITYGLDALYIHLHMTNAGLVLAAGPSGALYLGLFYMPIILASLIGWYMIKRSITNVSIFSTGIKRAAISIGVIFVFAILLLVLFRGIVAGITNQTGVIVPLKTNSTYVPIGQTTQELQPPSYGFLSSSFNLQLGFGAFVGYLLNQSTAVGNSMVVLITLLFAWIGILLFTQLGHRHAHPGHSTKSIKIRGINVTVNAAIIVILAYAAITTYLQLSAIRYNALISIPLAILAAYTVYILAMLVYDKRPRGIIAVLVVLFLVALSIYLFYAFHTLLGISFKAVLASVILIYAVLILLVLYLVYGLITKNLELMYVAVAIVLVILAYNFYNTYLESYTAVQADGINPQFLQAMAWLKNNTASNATVLALWPDGSVVEGWGNRTSYMDSVGGEYGARIFNFSKWLFNTSLDTQYLYGIHKPQYLVARNFWYAELGGIAQEGLVSNATDYGYITLTSLNSTNNGTATFFIFSGDVPPYYTAELVSILHPNSTTVGYKAYIGIRNSTRFTLMRSIIFFNSTSSGYTTYTIGNESNSANYTLMVLFSGHVINGAYILGPKLIQSNLFKFTFLCNAFSCPYNDSNVTMSVVYQDSDTKVLKINYLH